MRPAIVFYILTSFLEVSAQTRIAPPAAKINLVEVGQMNKANVKKFKQLDRFKSKKARVVSRQLKKHTGFSKEQIDGYTIMVKGLDSMALEDFQRELDNVIAQQESGYAQDYARVKREKERIEELEQEKSRQWEATRSAEFDAASLRTETPGLRKVVWTSVTDSATFLMNERLGTPFAMDSTKKVTMDSSAIMAAIAEQGKFNIDSSYLTKGQTFLKQAESLENQLRGDRIGIPATPADSVVMERVENGVESFLQSFAQSQVELQELGLTSIETPQAPSVQHFIPELEKFDYVKPKIPDEELTKALLEQEKQKKKDQLKAAVVPKLQKGDVEEREVSWIERLKIGGFVEYRPESELIEVTPTLAYGVMDKLLFGVGYSTVILLKKSSEIDRQIAYRTYLDYLLIKSFFLHLESEWKSQERPEMATLRERSTLLGIGREFGYKSFSTSVLGLFNFNAPNTIDTRRFSVRFALNFNP